MSDGADAEISVTITNKKGLHARAAAKFVKTVALFENTGLFVTKTSGAGVTPGGESAQVSGSSILGLMMLGAECNSTLRLRATGSQPAEALDALKKLIEGKFGEDVEG